MKKRLLRLTFHVVVVAIFLSISTYALLAAYGYQVDLLKQDIVKTGIIDVENKLKNIEVYFDDKKVSTKAPYQIKGVELGMHTILIKKLGYKPWERIVEVEEDIVSTIDDVYLIPEDLERFITYTDEAVVDIYDYSEKLFVTFNTDSSLLTQYSVDDEGNIQKKLVSLTLPVQSTITDFYLIDSQRVVLEFQDKIYVYSFASEDLTPYDIPQNTQKIEYVFNPDFSLYYLKNNQLFLYDLLLKEDLLLADNVNDFVITEEGIIILLNNNLWLMSFDGSVFLNYISDLSERDDELNVSIMNNGIYVLWGDENKLYKIENKQLTLLDESVSQLLTVSNNNQFLVYVTHNGELISYNLYENTRHLLARFENQPKNMFWFAENKQLLFEINNQVMLCNTLFENCGVMKTLNEQDELIVLPFSELFIILQKDSTLKWYQLKTD